MENHQSLLDGLTIASPCTVSWDAMKGDERARDCSQCRLRVYNLSAMTRPEAENLLAQKDGRLCVRFYRRADGTVMTKDCPVGLRAVRLKLARMAGAAFALVALLAAGLGLRRRQSCEVKPRQMMGEAATEAALQGYVPMAPMMGAPPPRAVETKGRTVLGKDQ